MFVYILCKYAYTLYLGNKDKVIRLIMTNATIYHRIKWIMSWAILARICPVAAVSSGSVHNVLQENKKLGDNKHNTREENVKMAYFYFKLSNVQCIFNIVYIFILAALLIISQAFLLNLCQNTTELLGWCVHMFTQIILPLFIIIFTNKNAGKVNEDTHL